MIADKDRSFYIGASDTDRVVCSWETKTFEKWWGIKLGYFKNDFGNEFTKTGNGMEHRILDSLGLNLEHDKQIITGRLRINLDGNTNDTIYECKTYRYKNGFKVPLKYRRQVWAQMYGTGIKKAYIVAYGLMPEDYKNWFLPIDKGRLSIHEIEYNEKFINETYLPRFRYLEQCLIDGRWPREEDIA